MKDGKGVIRNKEDLIRFLDVDRQALERNRIKPTIHDLIWRYEIALRKVEYYHNMAESVGGY